MQLLVKSKMQKKYEKQPQKGEKDVQIVVVSKKMCNFAK